MVTLIFTICTTLLCVDMPMPYYVPSLPTQCAIDGITQKIIWDEKHPDMKVQSWTCAKVK
jgi:hypothetical protein